MNSKSKRKQFYISQANKKQRKYVLDSGLKGFLCSCNGREKECVKESYNLLNKYADVLYPKETKEATEIEDDLSKELNELKSEQDSIKRFQVIDSGAKNFLFIRTTLDEPLKVCQEIIKDISTSGTQQTRYLLRLVPVQTTCKAYVDEIKTVLLPLLKEYFSDDVKSFSIAFNHRNNSSLNKDQVIKEVADLVGELDKKYTVNLKEPDVSIVIEIIRSFAFLAVIPGYFKFKKFNLHLLCESTETEKKEDLKQETEELEADENKVQDK